MTLLIQDTPLAANKEMRFFFAQCEIVSSVAKKNQVYLMKNYIPNHGLTKKMEE